MNKELKRNLIVFIISILILAGIGFGVYYFIIGEDGLIKKITSMETKFDKTEVLESLNELVKEKYMAIYNESKTNPDIKLEEAYNPDVAISYFFEKGVLDYYYYSNYDEQNKKYTYVKNENVTPETRKKR